MALDTAGDRQELPGHRCTRSGARRSRSTRSRSGRRNPLHLDHEAARAGRLRRRGRAADVRRRLLGAASIAPAILDPEVGIDFAHMVHGGQEFRWGPLVVAGDEITTTATVQDIADRARAGLLRVRDRVGQPARRDRVHRHLDQHRQGGRGRMKPGDEFELKVTPDRYLTVRYAGASGDFNPIHIDEEFARQVGLPGPHPARPVDDGPGRPRPHRGARRPRPARAPVGPVPRHGRARAGDRRPRRRSSEIDGRARARDLRGRAGRQADHPRRRGRRPASTERPGPGARTGPYLQSRGPC